MTFGFIAAEKAHYPVRRLCAALDVSPSGFYAWAGRLPSARAEDDRRLTQQLRLVHAESERRYGRPRLHRALRQQGYRVGVRRVRRLMRAAQIVARGRRRACRTTVSDPAATAANLLARRFHVARPNTVWAADITGLMTAEGWLYLAVLIDLASRKVVGWATRNTLEADVAVAALTRALETRDVGPGLLHHSDRGVQYTCDRYRGLLSRAGLTVSMSRVGNCWDNAVVESFFSSLKAELVPEPMWATRHDATAAIAQYMRFYNERRLHSSLGYCSPQQHEAKLAAVV